MMKKSKCSSPADRVFYTISGVLLTVLLLMVLYPLIFVVSASFSSGSAVSTGKVLLWPVGFNLEGYLAVFRKPDIFHSYYNTLVYTVCGTVINVFMVMITAYPLSRRDLRGKGYFMFLFTFTMLFNGGLMPNYLLIKSLHMIDNFWVMIIPGALSVYNMIIARTYIQTSIPTELLEASVIDGCKDIRYFSSIILPLSKPLISVIALFSAVGHWNSYFHAMIYLNTRSRYPLQIILREILVMNQIDLSTISDPELYILITNRIDVLKFALIIVATVPILCAYPFAQKYFIRGIMIGSLKG
jgi:multiple sugar transport system permease protein/putative aldouronate transport system permease protein